MEGLNLTETEQRYFSDLFVCCEVDNSGKIQFNKASELFRSGNIPSDTLNQIYEICGFNYQISSYVNKKQFFSMLKLIAAYQANIQIREDILSSNTELPLPRFMWPSSETNNTPPTNSFIELNERNHIRKPAPTYKMHVDSASTDSEVDQRDLNGTENFRDGSPEASSTASDSPTPTNSVQERSWAVGGNWQGLVSEEQRQLLGTEEESSDRHSSEDDGEITNEVWTITQEQREYYTNQFRSLQPDTNALLSGSIARMFFEKSRLPVSELRKIWQLSDVTKDGALSLEEFNTAMHLVVLRRNHIPLPNILPPELVPKESVRPKSPRIPSVSPPQLEPQTQVQNQIENSKEWTKFVESPTSSISSPGPKPVNFDFQKVAVEKDPKILHPVPLRLTPDKGGPPPEDEPQSPKKLEHSNHNDLRPIQRPQPKKIPTRGVIPPPPQVSASASLDEGPISLPAPKKDPPPPPPPRPFRSHGRSSSLDLNKLGKGFLGAPPMVPPRVSPNISSPSHNKKLINQRSEGDVILVSEGAFANFDQFQKSLEIETEKYENVSDGIFPGDLYEAERKKLFAQFMSSPSDGNQDTTDSTAPRRHGAFEVYRKPMLTNKKESPLPLEDAARWELFRNLKEQNTVLLRLCQELSQELADIREERTLLRLRLEQSQQTAG